jgi:MFS family permease
MQHKQTCALSPSRARRPFVQGIVGSVPWQAMVWFTVFFQLRGYTDLQAAALMAAFSFGCALGGLLGGTLGDRLARRFPNSPNGRILTNQASVLIGLPLSFLLLKGLPPGQHLLLYGAVLFVFGLCISWCGCNNSALFAELVPEEQRSTIYAFDRSFEGAVGAMGAPLVGVAAERLFGFRGSLGAPGASADAGNVAALGSALLVCMVGPWLLCLLFFTGKGRVLAGRATHRFACFRCRPTRRCLRRTATALRIPPHPPAAFSPVQRCTGLSRKTAEKRRGAAARVSARGRGAASSHGQRAAYRGCHHCNACSHARPPPHTNTPHHRHTGTLPSPL